MWRERERERERVRERSDLDIVLQAPDQLPVHLSGLSHPDAAALGLAEPVLQDAAGLVGLLQLQPQLLQLVHLLLLKHVPHLHHLAVQLLHLILGGGVWTQTLKTWRSRAVRGTPVVVLAQFGVHDTFSHTMT